VVNPFSKKIIAVIGLLLVIGTARASTSADLVLKNGSIYTLDKATPWVEAVAVRDGKYVAVGSIEKIAEWIDESTTVIDLEGAMAMPGINDVHQHPLDGGYEVLFECHFPPQSDFNAILEAVSDCAQKSQPGDWIIGGAWSSQHLERLASLDALAALDKVSEGHPVFLRDDTFHNRWVNTEVLKRAEITTNTKDPAGGVIVKDTKTGKPTGLFKEFPSFLSIEAIIPARQADRMQAAAAEAIRLNNALGITGIQDAYSSEQYLKSWRSLDQNGRLSAWLVASLPVAPGKNPNERFGEALVTTREEFRTAHLRPDFVKLFLDGVPPARTAFFLHPYLPDEEHGSDFHGLANYDIDELSRILKHYRQLGLKVKLHATGDASVRLALDAIEQVQESNSTQESIFHIAHASFIAAEDIPRFKALNVTADLSPMLWFPTGLWYATVAVLGEERATRFWPVRDLLDSDVMVAGGSDWPAGQPTSSPWIGIEGLVTRRNPLGEVPGELWSQQSIKLAEALRLYTLDSARAMGLGEVTGSITVGKSADLIVLDRNLFEIPVEQIHNTEVTQIYFQGQLLNTHD